MPRSQPIKHLGRAFVNAVRYFRRRPSSSRHAGPGMPGPYDRRLSAVGARHASPANRATTRYRNCEMAHLGRAQVAALTALWLLVTPAAPAHAKDAPPGQAQCRQVPEISRQLSEITGLPLRHPVPCSVIDKQRVNAFLKRRMKEVASPQDIRAEELTLKKFGLVPRGFRPGHQHRGSAHRAGRRLLRLQPARSCS